MTMVKTLRRSVGASAASVAASKSNKNLGGTNGKGAVLLSPANAAHCLEIVEALLQSSSLRNVTGPALVAHVRELHGREMGPSLAADVALYEALLAARQDRRQVVTVSFPMSEARKLAFLADEHLSCFAGRRGERGLALARVAPKDCDKGTLWQAKPWALFLTTLLTAGVDIPASWYGAYRQEKKGGAL